MTWLIAPLAAIILAAGGFVLARELQLRSLTAEHGPSPIADEAEAAQVLGRPLPKPTWLPQGVVRASLTVDPAEAPVLGIPSYRFVRQAYMIEFRNVAILALNKGNLGQVQGRSGDPEVTGLGGTRTLVTSKQIDDGTTLVTYYWERGGLVYQFTVNLIKGIDRQSADRIVASID